MTAAVGIQAAFWLIAGLASLVLAGCASPVPKAAERGPAAAGAADQAAKMVGKPYRYGGASPAGFDCSGLVQYSFRQAGRSVPRSTEEQRGDLLFFHQEGRKNSHVGIYVGGGEFVHAPSSGKQVRRDRLDSPYWRQYLSEARRI